MRFSDLFVSYKIRMKDIDRTISFRGLSLYRKVFAILLFVLVSFLLIGIVFKAEIMMWISIASILLLFMVLSIFDSKKRNLETMLKDHYMPYSNSVMAMLRSLLEEYNIDYTKDDVIDLLIEQAESERENCDYIKPLIRPFKVMAGLIIPIAAYIGKKIIDDAEMIEAFKFSLLIIFIIIVLFAAVIAFAPLLKEMNPNYIKYTEFIYNLKQLKIFKENKDK